MTAPRTSPTSTVSTPWFRRRTFVVGAAAVAALVAIGVLSITLLGKDSSSTSADAGALFSLETPYSDIQTSGRDFTVTIPEDERVTWFASRPSHQGGTMTLADFVARWTDMGFVDDPPNAALVVREDDLTRTHVVEITAVSATDSQVVLTVSESDETDHSGRTRTHPLSAGSRDHTELFIDSVNCSASCASGSSTPSTSTTTTTAPPPTTTTTVPPSAIQVLGVTPSSGAAGDAVVLSGAHLDDVEAVYVNGVPVDAFTVASGSSLTTSIPGNATTGVITTYSSKRTSYSSTRFTVTSPAVTSFSPTTAGHGANITVMGANLGGATAVRIGGVDVPFSQIGSGVLSVTVGNGSFTGSISVTTPIGRATSTNALTVTGPAITGFNPGQGVTGTSVTITGVNLVGVKAVSIGGRAAKFSSQSSTQLTAIVPDGAVNSKILVSTSDTIALSVADFIAAPRVDSLNPTSGIPGSTVTLTGVDLSSVTALHFTGSTDTVSTFTVVNDTTITATVPIDATTGAIAVTGSGRATTPKFTVKPLVTEAVPVTGAPGTWATLSGGGFTDIKSVRVGSTSVTPRVTGTTQLAFTIPTNAAQGAATITVTTGAGTATSTFTVFTPTGTPALTGAPAVPSPTAAPAITVAPTNGSSVTLASNVTYMITTGTANGSAWSGTGTVHTGGFSFPATLSITSAHDWVVTPTGAGTLVVNGRHITTTALTGLVSTVGGTTWWSIAGSVTSRTVLVDGTVTILGADVTLVPDCPPLVSTVFCGTGPYLRLDGTTAPKGLEIKIGSGVPDQADAPFRAAYNAANGAFDLAANYTAASIASWAGGSVTMTDLQMRLAYGDSQWAVMTGPVSVPHRTANNGFDVEVVGKGHVAIPSVHSWNISRLAANYVDGGVIVSGSVDAPAKTGPTFVTDFAYSQIQPSVQAQILGTTMMLNAQTYLLSGSASMPKFLKETLGLPDAPVGAYVTYTSGGYLEVTGVIPFEIKIPKSPHISSTFDSAILRATINLEAPETEYSFSLAAQGTASIDGGAPFGAEVKIAYESRMEGKHVDISLSAWGENGRAIWPSMFGVNGFDLTSFSLQIGVIPIFPYIEIGIAGDGVLPTHLREYMGIDSHAKVPVKFVADLSTVSPCLQVTVGDPGSSTPFLSFGGGAITATYASMAVSATGCTVGMYEVPAGVRIKIDGQMFGAKVDGFAAFNPLPSGPPGMQTPSFFGHLKVEGNPPGPGIAVDIEVHMSGGGWYPTPYFQLRGGVTIDKNDRILVTGDCHVTSYGPDCNVAGDGELDLGPVTMKSTLAATHILSSHAVFSASGEVEVVGVKLQVAGTFEPGGVRGRSYQLPSWSFTGSADFPKGSLVDEVSVEFGMNNGLPFGSAYLHGDLGGTFKDLTGKSGRFKVGGKFEVDVPSYHGETDLKINLGVTQFDIILGIDVCMQGDCAGKVTPIVKFKNFKGFDFSKSPIPFDAKDWSFTATVHADWSDSGKVGDDWAGLKGEINADVYLKVSTDNGGAFQISASASAKAYIGVGGKWDSLGTYGVSFNLDKPEFCLDTHGYKICV